MRKTTSRKSKKVSRTSKRAMQTLVRQGYDIDRKLQAAERRAERKAERAAIADFNAEIRYCGLVALQRTWKMPRFRKLAKLAAKYLRTLNATLNDMRKVRPWLDGKVNA